MLSVIFVCLKCCTLQYECMQFDMCLHILFCFFVCLSAHLSVTFIQMAKHSRPSSSAALLSEFLTAQFQQGGGHQVHVV